MRIDLDGKTALVTGGAEGIGWGCVRCLLKCGANVVWSDRRNLCRKVERLNNDAEPIFPVFSDFFQARSRRKLLSSAKSAFNLQKRGKALDIIVCNPYLTIRKSALETSIADIRRVLNATLVSHIDMARIAAQDMIKYGARGSIVFISSVYGTLPRKDSLAYDISKAGINQAVKVLALEFAAYSIRVNAVAPGFTDTPGERKLASEEAIALLSSRLPLKRACQPKDIGNLVAFLCSDFASMITGQVITIDAGMSLDPPAN